MTTDIEYESYSKDTDIDMNEKVDTQKNVGNKRQTVDSVRDGQLSVWKIWKRRFFQDIPISFQWVTGNGLKPPQFFPF